MVLTDLSQGVEQSGHYQTALNQFELVLFAQFGEALELTASVMGTNIHGLLIFEWVLKFRIWVLTVMISTCIYGVLVFDGYLFS